MPLCAGSYGCTGKCRRADLDAILVASRACGARRGKAIDASAFARRRRLVLSHAQRSNCAPPVTHQPEIRRMGEPTAIYASEADLAMVSRRGWPPTSLTTRLATSVRSPTGGDPDPRCSSTLRPGSFLLLSPMRPWHLPSSALTTRLGGRVRRLLLLRRCRPSRLAGLEVMIGPPSSRPGTYRSSRREWRTSAGFWVFNPLSPYGITPH